MMLQPHGKVKGPRRSQAKNRKCCPQPVDARSGPAILIQLVWLAAGSEPRLSFTIRPGIAANGRQ